MEFEIRLHGRGGQGGVTCAKILAATYARLGYSVQSFGDYAGERSGAPVRAYTRVSDAPITNRNKVYEPHHLLVLDPTLLGSEIVQGLASGGTLLINVPGSLGRWADSFDRYRLATVDATSIARRHGIGTRSVVIVNTTIAGAFARVMSVPFTELESAFRDLGLLSNLPAAKEAYEAVVVHEPTDTPALEPLTQRVRTPSVDVLPLTEHREGASLGLRTGSWRTQRPSYAEHLAPCNAWCPAGNDVITAIQTLARSGEDEAAAVWFRTQPLAGVCGRVCPAPCMEGCNRREYDGEVDIRGLERWVADRTHVRVRPEACDDPKRVAIIGGGPAGLSAAFSLASRGHRPVIFEGEVALGGVLRTGIPTYRLPREVFDREIDALMSLGVEARCRTFTTPTMVAGLADEFDAVIIATGLQTVRELDVPGRRLEGIEQ
ncbi:MAG: 2-oxoacid:acceptor oxidoreductase family protein, partial [Planctomycetes bacterium]|nr:2-oxoacid:acceptor oxidoreductase family protein [Planctomycetota bacterium]